MVEINNVLEHVEGDEITGITNKDHWDNEVERKLSEQMVEAKGLVQLLYSIHWQIYLKSFKLSSLHAIGHPHQGRYWLAHKMVSCHCHNMTL